MPRLQVVMPDDEPEPVAVPKGGRQTGVEP